jgi:hypothetical protein
VELRGEFLSFSLSLETLHLILNGSIPKTVMNDVHAFRGVYILNKKMKLSSKCEKIKLQGE